MLTVDQLKAMPEGTMFATGEALDVPEGLFMSRSGRNLRWVAVRGSVHDWTIYCHFAENTAEWIRRSGDKVFDKVHIKRCVPCDDEAYALYRR